MTGWALKDWLEALAYVVTILAPIVTGLVFLLRKRTQDLGRLAAEMARAWTNEGDISADEPVLLHLYLQLENGDVYGSLRTSAHDRSFEAQLTVHWHSATLKVSELFGRNLIPVATVRLTLVGNRNRLDWRLGKLHEQYVMPRRTLLWPEKLPDINGSVFHAQSHRELRDD